jgi:hypothetical protein
MYMIRAKMPFLDGAFALHGQAPEYLTQLLPQLAIQYLSAAFWNPNDVVLAVPDAVA